MLDDLTVRPTSSTVRTLAEATLAVVLFSDSSRVNLRARHLIDDAWRQIIPLAAAVLAYGIANALGGSGFIAASRSWAGLDHAGLRRSCSQ